MAHIRSNAVPNEVLRANYAILFCFSTIALVAAGCVGATETPHDQRAKHAIGFLKGRLQDIEYLHFDGLGPGLNLGLRRDDFTAAELSNLLPIDLVRRQTFKHVLSELENSKAHEEGFGPFLISATLDQLTLTKWKSKEVPKDIITLEWLESLSSTSREVSGFFIRFAGAEEIVFANSLTMLRNDSDDVTPYQSVGICLAQSDTNYSDLDAMLKERSHRFCVTINKEMIGRMRKTNEAEFEVGLILQDGSRTSAVPLVSIEP